MARFCKKHKKLISKQVFMNFFFFHLVSTTINNCCNICSCNLAGGLCGCLDFMVFAKCLG